MNSSSFEAPFDIPFDTSLAAVGIANAADDIAAPDDPLADGGSAVMVAALPRIIEPAGPENITLLLIAFTFAVVIALTELGGPPKYAIPFCLQHSR